MEPEQQPQQGLYLGASPLRIIACGYVDGELATMSFPLNDEAAASLAMSLLAQIELHQRLESAAKDVDFLRRAGVSVQ